MQSVRVSRGFAMERELRAAIEEARGLIKAAHDRKQLDELSVRFLGRRGSLTLLLQNIPSLPPSERPAAGQIGNDVKQEFEDMVRRRAAALSASSRSIDPTLPGIRPVRGHLHPITRYSRRMLDIWRSFGYDVHEGPELERDWYNFEALNMPKDHPARDTQDTFYIKDHPDLVLRTHSSTVQLRAMLHRRPPLQFVEIGRVYRNEATDASHESMFTQCDGIVIDRHLSMAHLVGTLRVFLRTLFGAEAQIRVRPSYFPFVEPGIEMDMRWTVNGAERWLEMLGAGLVHPNVLRAMKLDPKRWRGFAFGMGVDRLAMLHYGFSDIRLSYSGNLDFLKQF